MRLLAGTGIRIGELEYVTVMAIVKGSCIVFNKEKYHQIYIPCTLQEELLKYCRKEKISSGPIFLGNRQTPVSRSGVWKMLKKLAEMVGVPEEKVHPHSFRHLFAKSYRKQYGDITELADILGHSSIEMTRIYTVTTVEEKRSRLNSLKI
jgi:site-specific recombinase XerD